MRSSLFRLSILVLTSVALTGCFSVNIEETLSEDNTATMKAHIDTREMMAMMEEQGMPSEDQETGCEGVTVDEGVEVLSCEEPEPYNVFIEARRDDAGLVDGGDVYTYDLNQGYNIGGEDMDPEANAQFVEAGAKMTYTGHYPGEIIEHHVGEKLDDDTLFIDVLALDGTENMIIKIAKSDDGAEPQMHNETEAPVEEGMIEDPVPEEVVMLPSTGRFTFKNAILWGGALVLIGLMLLLINKTEKAAKKKDKSDK